MISLIVYKRQQVTASTCAPVYICLRSPPYSRGTESEKSKAGLRNWNINNPGKLEEAGISVALLFTLVVKTTYVVLDPGVPDEYQDFWNGMTQYLDWFDVLPLE
jgi:hypothetical protein